jgi:parallel beta-helix repeat protein
MISSTVNTVIYLYYGNGAAPNQENVTAVWDSDYVMVQHLQETSGTHLDSTSTKNDGSPKGGVTQTATGRVDGADLFDGNNDYIEIADSSSLRVVEMTLEAWVRIPGSLPSGYRGIVQHAYNTDNWYGLWKSGNGNRFHFRWSTGDVRRADFSTTISPDTWYYVVGVLDPVASKAYCYLNGNLDKTVSNPDLPPPSGGSTLIGAALNVSEWFDGTIDEVRISKIARSEAWIKASFRNLDSPAAYQTVGGQERDLLISGTIFEDINYGGGDGRDFAAADSSAQASGWAAGAIGCGAGVVVELYQDQGGSFIKVAATTTDASGNYSFSGVLDGTYRVRVVNGTVPSNRGSNATGQTPLAIQTFRNDPDSGGPVTNEVGGANPDNQDAGAQANGTNLSAITAQSATEIAVSGADIGNVDFGFNFDTIVNVQDSGQGSLRQFLLNSNELSNANLDQEDAPGGVWPVTKNAGNEHAIFMIPATELVATIDGGGGSVMRIQPSSALPFITDTNTTVDGRTQTAYTGDTNTAVAETTTGPEVIIDLQGAVASPVLVVRATNTTVDSLGLTGASGANNDGIDATVGSLSGLTFRNNTIFGNGAIGIFLGPSKNSTILNNVIRNNGLGESVADGISIRNGSSNIMVSGNGIIANAGYGIDLNGPAANRNITITGNLIKGNGTSGSDQDAGIGIRAADNCTITLNTITENDGEGILVASGNSGNLISQNSIFSNDRLGIDLSATTDNFGDEATLNDDGDGDPGGNGLLNFPILQKAIVSDGNLVLAGFARPGSTIELFIADPDPSNFGEGQTYLATLTEGASGDTDGTTGTYGPGPVNGINQGTDTTNRFEFTIPLPGGVSGGTALTATATLAGATSEFSGTVTARELPDIILLKISQTISDPVNGTTNPKAIPGAVVLYTLNATNQGTGATDTDSLKLTEAVSANTTLFVGDLGGAGSGPVQFLDGATASGLSYTFTSLDSATDDVEFSNDDGVTYSYTPTPAGEGFDSAVTHIRILPKGPFASASGGNKPSFQLKFKVRVK